MTNDPSFDDLTALFEAEDQDLNDPAFTDGVMRQVKRRKYSRRVLLALAGGIGGLLSVPQLITAYATWPVADRLTSESLVSLSDRVQAYSSSNPTWFLIGAMVLGVIVLASSLERA